MKADCEGWTKIAMRIDEPLIKACIQGAIAKSFSAIDDQVEVNLDITDSGVSAIVYVDVMVRKNLTECVSGSKG